MCLEKQTNISKTFKMEIVLPTSVQLRIEGYFVDFVLMKVCIANAEKQVANYRNVISSKVEVVLIEHLVVHLDDGISASWIMET